MNANGVIGVLREMARRMEAEKGTLPADGFEEAFPAWYESVLAGWKK